MTSMRHMSNIQWDDLEYLNFLSKIEIFQSGVKKDI